MNTIRKLPIGIQDFEKLRSKNFIYVDKTHYVYLLAQLGVPYFLGRPRRFGKSLFLSTLKAYFEGKKELFEGLKIAGLEKDWTKYPIIYLDFNVGLLARTENVAERINVKIEELEQLWGKKTNTADLASRFEAIIKSAYEQTGKRVVVLIDEYDKPLINTMNDPIANDEIRTLLKSFYGVLKSMDAYLRFVFLTGVTKFSQVSIFSDLNQLVDISLDKQFAEICGISETELLQNFQPEIHALAEANDLTYEQTLAKLKKMYDGYHFAKVSEDIYNPFSLLNTFAKSDFAYYWFATGTTTFLAKTLKNQHYDIRKFDNDVDISASSVMDYRVENQNLIPLLYQSGYLTIKSYNKILNTYTLGFPNEEVKYGFLNELLPAFVQTPITTGNFSVTDFLKQLMNGDVEGFMASLKAFFADIPYDAIEQKNRNEQYYQHVFYLLFTLMGQFVQTEVKNCKGRADAVVKTADAIYIFEFKMDSNATAEEAIKQINSNDYAIPYSTAHRKTVKIGVEFSQAEKGIKRWLIE
ncbi:MAG: ATP-binding protein [Prevotellaceae bacterium]|jgi:hypothetical protein|nr:ATP-binding protein [Prevotellaceae bacterium]